MVILPNQTDFTEVGFPGEPIAYSYVGAKKSFYKDPYGSQVWVQLHEIGHNLGLGHSGLEGESSYGDKTCMMGSFNGNDDAPQLCYNAAKSWFLGWYESGHHQVPTNDYWEGKLVSIPDYLEPGYSDPKNSYRSIVNIGNLYMQFNRKKHPTLGFLPEDEDKVTVVKQDDQSLGSVSWKLGDSLGVGDQVVDGELTVKVLAIDIEAKIPYARVAVYNKQMFDEPKIRTPNVDPAKFPTIRPTYSPILAPTMSPTYIPMNTPSTSLSTDLVIFEVFPNPKIESDKDAEYIRLFNPSYEDQILLGKYQVYDATSNRYVPLNTKRRLGPRQSFVLCRNKARFNNLKAELPSGASGGCHQEGQFNLHDRLSTIILQRKAEEVSGGDFYEDIDAVQIVDAIRYADSVYTRRSNELYEKTECASCWVWRNAYD